MLSSDVFLQLYSGQRDIIGQLNTDGIYSQWFEGTLKVTTTQQQPKNYSRNAHTFFAVRSSTQSSEGHYIGGNKAAKQADRQR